MKLLQNAVYIKEADLFIKSTHTHDFVGHQWPDGKELFIDGGLDYARREGDLFVLNMEERYEEYCLTDEDAFEHVADRLLWGSRGKDGDQPLAYRTIKEYAYREDGMNHLRAILANCLNISPLHKQVVEYWLAKRRSEVGTT